MLSNRDTILIDSKTVFSTFLCLWTWNTSYSEGHSTVTVSLHWRCVFPRLTALVSQCYQLNITFTAWGFWGTTLKKKKIIICNQIINPYESWVTVEMLRVNEFSYLNAVPRMSHIHFFTNPFCEASVNHTPCFKIGSFCLTLHFLVWFFFLFLFSWCVKKLNISVTSTGILDGENDILFSKSLEAPLLPFGVRNKSLNC